MPNFNPPNPYGSYFDFREPSSLARAALLSDMAPGVSAGVGAAMGSPTGGFNPTLEEFQSNRMRDVVYQQHMQRALMEDPRVGTVSNLLLSAMYGNNTAAKADMMKRFGGQGGLNEMVGFAMGMPGISGFFGGSPRSMALGALGAATGGMRATIQSGGSMSQLGMFGDSPMAAIAATSILRNVRSQFFSPSGASNTAMTQGLNQDQIGGLLMQGGVQGAFAGLNMGKFNMVQGKASLMADSSTMDRITKFVKDAAKSISSLIDVYGNSDVATLLNKAKQITGLDITSRLGNADTFNQRMSQLRNVGQATGIDIQSMADVSAGAVRLGMSYGLTPAGSGAIAHGAAMQSANRFREFQTLSGSMYLPSISQGEFAANYTRDAVGMLDDPLGARRNAIELLAQQGRLSQSAVAGMRDHMNQIGTSGGPQEIDAMVSKYGINLPAFISSQGGSRRVYESLNETNKFIAIENQKTDSKTRAEAWITRSYYQAVGSGAGKDQMLSLIRNLGAGTLQNVFKAYGEGDTLGANAALLSDSEGMRDPAKYMAMVAGLGGAVGKENLAGIHAGLVNSMHNSASPFVSNYASVATERDRIRLSEAARPELSNDFRGRNRSTFLQGFLEHRDMKDPASILAIMSTFAKDRVTFFNLDPSTDVTTEGGKSKWIKDVTEFREQFMKTSEGRKMLATVGLAASTGVPTWDNPVASREYIQKTLDLHTVLNDEFSRERLFSKHALFGKAGGPQAVVSKEDYDYMSQDDTAARMAMVGSAASYIMSNGGAKSPEERAILEGAKMMQPGGKMHRFEPETGKIYGSGIGAALTLEERKTVNERLGSMFASASRVERLITRGATYDDSAYSRTHPDEKLLDIYASNKTAAQQMMNILVDRERILAGRNDNLSVEEKSLIKNTKFKLKDKGAVELPNDVQTAVSVITGSLKLDADKGNLVFGNDVKMTTTSTSRVAPQ